MRAPRLNRWMVLEALEESPNGSGGVVRSWHEVARHWVALERVGTARAVEMGAGAVSRVPCRLLVRGRGDEALRPQAGQRFRESGRVFAILAVSEGDPEGRYLACQAQEEVWL